MERISTLLIEPSQADAQMLEHLLLRHPALRVTRVVTQFSEAAEAMGEDRPQLVFLSVEPAGSLDFLESIPADVRVIFLAESGHHALRAFEVNALDYLVKPIHSERLAETVRRILCLDWRPSKIVEIAANDQLFVPLEGRRAFIAVREIAAIRAFGNYSQVCRTDGRTELVLRSLFTWERLLPERIFVRASRAALVNIEYVKLLKRTVSGGTILEVTGVGEPIEVSRRNVSAVARRLDEERGVGGAA